jgi:hypothetical protein
MKILVKERMACWVDFYYECDESIVHDDDAIDEVGEGKADYIGCSIQDNIEFCDSETEIVDSIPCGIERG